MVNAGPQKWEDLERVPLFSLNTARAGEVLLASHSLTVPSAEQDSRRWWALLYTSPHTESVCPDSAPRRTDGSVSGGERETFVIRAA